MSSKKQIFFYVAIGLTIGGLIASTIVFGLRSGKTTEPADYASLKNMLDVCQNNAGVCEREKSRMYHVSPELRGSCDEGWIQLSGEGSITGIGSKSCYNLHEQY